MDITHETSYQQALSVLTDAANEYYHGTSQTLTDKQYDELFRAVSDYEQGHGLSSDATSKVAAGTSTEGLDVAHKTPMLSLDNAMHGTSELQDWFGRTDTQGSSFVVEPKLDGLAASITYEAGKLVTIATRGDGYTGEDVTERASSARGIPADLNADINIEIRGEIVLTEDDLVVANELRDAHGDKPFVNARNGAAGALRGASGRSYEIPLTFGAYSVAGGEFSSHVEAMDFVASHGVITAREMCDRKSVSFHDPAQVQAEIDAIEEARFTSLTVAIDGAVVKVNDTNVVERLGATAKAPRSAIAYKYAAQEVTTKLIDIEFNTGRTGVLAPRAVLEPVECAGVVISYATVSNPGQVVAKGLKLGATVVVRRAGDVVPEIVGVVTDAEYDGLPDWEPPTECGICGAGIDKSSLRWRCERRGSCNPIERLVYAMSRKCFDVEGLSEKRISMMVEAGLATDTSDFFALEKHQIVELDRMGELSAQNILDEIEGAKQQPLDRLLTSLGIEFLGTTLSRRICEIHHDLEDIRSLSVSQLSEIDGFSEIRGQKVFDGLNENSDLLDRLISAGVRTTAEVSQVSTGAPLAGKTVVVSGSVPGMNRDQVKQSVSVLGGKAGSSVSKNTDLLVADPDSSSSKVKKAVELGIQIMDPADYAQLYQQHS